MREAMLDRESSLRRAKMEASVAEGISWGMGEDAIEEDEVIMTDYMTYIVLPLELLNYSLKFYMKTQVDHF